MAQFYMKIAISIYLVVQFVPTFSMFATIRNRYARGMAKPSSGYIGQKRYQSRSAQLKGQSRIITNNTAKTKSPDFPAQGAAVADSYFLKNIVLHKQSISNVADPLAVLTNELFKIDDNGTISIVTDKDKVSRLLTPEFFGVLRGAQEKDLLGNPEVVTRMLELGKAESVKVEAVYSEEKMRKFIEAMNDVSKNKVYLEIAQPLEDAYLFLRANPHNSHDFTHYLLGFNTYSTILSDYQIELFQGLPWSIPEYDNNDYRSFHEALSEISMPKDRVEYAKKHFPQAVSAILEEKRNQLLYCPRVVMSHGSYNKQPAFSTCAESAFRDLFNNLFFDETKGVFDPLGFFPHLDIKKELVSFFAKYNTADGINSKDREYDPQQGFVNLVSGKDSIKYVHNGYEISSIDNEQNLIKLCNYFFSIKASNLHELGEILSNNRRTISFDKSSRDATHRIAINIDDKATGKKKYMHLYFRLGHSWFEVGDKKAEKVFLDINTLIADFNDPRSKSLLYAHRQPMIDNLFFERIQKNIKDKGSIFEGSLYYAFPVRNDHEKELVITAISLYSNKDQQALDYARYLFKSLSQDKQKSLKKNLSKRGALERLDNFSSLSNDFITLIE